MSKPMQILLGVFGLLLVVAVGLSMFGKLDLPIGPLNGMLAGEEDIVADAGADPLAGGVGTTLGDCVDPLGGGAAGGVTDPAAGGVTDPAAAGGVTDPTAGGVTDPNASVPVDPNAPVAAGSGGWNGDSRIVAAGAGDASIVSDSRVVAAEADPATGLPVDPAADGAVDPAAAGAVDPAAATGATDPAAAVGGVADPNATGVVDPCADQSGGAAAGVDPAAGGAGAATDPLAGAGTNAGAGAGGGAAANHRTTSDGTNAGNSFEALAAAKDATGVMQKANIQVTTTATLVPSIGGVARPAALKRYRATVTAAVLVMKLDGAAKGEWTGAGKKVQTDLVKSFLKRLGKRYAKATRSITVVDDAGTVLAVGDAAPGAAGTVKLF